MWCRRLLFTGAKISKYLLNSSFFSGIWKQRVSLQCTYICTLPNWLLLNSRGGDMNKHREDIQNIGSIHYFTSSEVRRSWNTSPYQGALLIDSFGSTICWYTVHLRNIFWYPIYLKLFILSFQCGRPLYYLEDKMNSIYIYHILVLNTDFRKRKRKLLVTALQPWIISNFYRLKKLWCSLPNSASSTVVRYLWDIFVMYSRFVGRNCRYIGPSDVWQRETYRWVQRFRKK